MPQLLVDKGLKTLGEMHKAARIKMGWSIDKLRIELMKRTGVTLSKSSISGIENGHHNPGWNTLAIISAAGYLVDPQTQEPFSTEQLFHIACRPWDHLSTPRAAEDTGEYNI